MGEKKKKKWLKWLECAAVVESRGRRKESTAIIKFYFGILKEGVSCDLYSFPESIEINKKPCIEYLQRNPTYLSYLRAPFCLRKGQLCTDKEDITIHQPLIFLGNPEKTGRYALTGIKIQVRGGGLKGQVQAMQLGIARALEQVYSGRVICDPLAADNDPAATALAFGSNTTMLRKSGFLTRDSRCKERKKYGLKKARKASQYSKR